VPLSAVERIEVSLGVSRAASGFEGAVGGAFLGALTGWTLYNAGLPGANFRTRGRAVRTSAAFGAGFGLLGGMTFPRERWRPMPLPASR
jgi:hypothetical protein